MGTFFFFFLQRNEIVLSPKHMICDALKAAWRGR